LNPLHTVGDAFDPTLPQCNALVCPANNEGISQLQLGELTDLEPMTLMRILNRMQSDGWQEVRNGPMGSWVEVVQRVPVRLQLVDVDAGFLPRAGLSGGVPVDDLTAAPGPPRSLYLSMEQIAGADIC
jgi:hypothetical protein